MKRILLSAVAVLLCACFSIAPAAAQTASCTLTQIAGQTTHETVLKWLAPIGVSSIGFNIYRANGTCTSATACTFAKIQASWPASVLTYTDTGLTPGSSYSYYLTAYDLAGVNAESVPSNVCSGTVPNPTSGGGTRTPPPTGVSGTVQ